MKISPTIKNAILMAGGAVLLVSLVMNGVLYNQTKQLVDQIKTTVTQSTPVASKPIPQQPLTDENTDEPEEIEHIVLDIDWQKPVPLSDEMIIKYRLRDMPWDQGLYGIDSNFGQISGVVKNAQYLNWNFVVMRSEPGMGGYNYSYALIPPNDNANQEPVLLPMLKNGGSTEDYENRSYFEIPNQSATLPGGKVVSVHDSYFSWDLNTAFSGLIMKTMKTKEGYTVSLTDKGYYFIEYPGGIFTTYFEEPIRDNDRSDDSLQLQSAGIQKNLLFVPGSLAPYEIGGCGGPATVVFIDSSSNKNAAESTFKSSELKAIRTGTGSTVYRVTNLQHPAYERAYEQWYLPSWKDGLKPTYEEFLKMNDLPFFLFKDSVGTWTMYTAAGIGSFAECGKPVIYLYPPQETEVHVKLPTSIDVTVSEPTYPKNGWTTVAKPNGDLTMSDGSRYTSLFWEGYGATYKTPTTGFIVKGQDVESFLNTTLRNYGLNDQETKEFSEFWVPIMKEYPTTRVSFITDEWDQNVPLDVTPKPDTTIRLFMDWSPVSADATIEKPKEVTTAKRSGFTLVEWGGLLRR